MNGNIKISIALYGLLAMLTGCAAGSLRQGNAIPSPAAVSNEPLTVDVLAGSGNPVLGLVAASCSASAFAEGDGIGLDIERILAGGAKAPSAKNAQPWHFTVIRDHEITSGLPVTQRRAMLRS